MRAQAAGRRQAGTRPSQAHDGGVSHGVMAKGMAMTRTTLLPCPQAAPCPAISLQAAREHWGASLA